MNHERLLEIWLQEESKPFSGWDFSYLDGRLIEEEPPWSYAQRAAELMASADSVIDLDTGGGERLLELRQYWPRITVATENYSLNTRLAYERLSRWGVPVIEAISNETVALPLASETFDLIINRNSAFHPADVARVLRSGGTFLTHQVHGLNLQDLSAMFGASPQWPDASPERYVPLLQAAGLTIVKVENWRGHLHFKDVGAVVYFLKAVPWLVPDFKVNSYQDVLFQLQSEIERQGEVLFESRLYMIEARK